MYYRNKVRMIRYQVMQSAQWIWAWMKLTVIAVSMYVHLSNGLIQSFEIRNTLRVWIHSGYCGFILWECCTCPLLNAWWFAITFHHFSLYLKECAVISKFGFTVLCSLTREKAYIAQSHCLPYTFTGLHEMYHHWRWPFHPMVP